MQLQQETRGLAAIRRVTALPALTLASDTSRLCHPTRTCRL